MPGMRIAEIFRGYMPCQSEDVIAVRAIDALTKLYASRKSILTKSVQERAYAYGAVILILTLGIRMLLAQRKQAEAQLKAIAWLLREGRKPFTVPKPQPYGELPELNTAQTILRTVGKDLLVNVAGDALHLIGTSGSVCERNGDYASCLVASDWCRFLDTTSRERCATTDNGLRW